jgi:hypothetical protein
MNMSKQMKKKEIQREVCPFWSPTERICKKLAAGLFIPLEDHVEIYCRTSQHTLCRIFCLSEHADQEIGKTDQEIKSSNRRKHTRVKTSHHLTLVRLSDSGHVVCEQPAMASTLDISSGGMRLTTRELLMHDSMIQFHFKGAVPSSLKSGLARVKWCVPTRKDLRYQAGLAFQNDQVIQAMDEYLDSRT